MAERPFDRIRVTVIDGAGCGEAVNRRQAYPRDILANSLTNASGIKPIHARALQSMGLEHVPGLTGMRVEKPTKRDQIRGAFGALAPTFAGNGSPEGHQALMGHIVTHPYLLFDETGFPPEVVQLVRDTVAQVVRRPVEIARYPGTDDINGVQFINHPGIGDAHLTSGTKQGPLAVPVYASSDSLIQIALHQGVVPQEQIEMIGKAVRAAADQARLRIARIIMRPFTGGPTPGTFTRVAADRRDYGVDPDEPTLIDYLAEAGIPVYGIGKAASMLNEHGFRHENIRKGKDDEARMRQAVADMATGKGPRFDFDNMVGTDELWGHPRKPREYVEHIGMLDQYIAEGMRAMGPRDLWIFTADHGNDPTQKKHNNHTNESTPLLVCSPGIQRAVALGRRESYADVAKTVAENFGIADKIRHGTSFLDELSAD